MSDEKPEAAGEEEGKKTEASGESEGRKGISSQAADKAKAMADSAGQKIKSMAASPELRSVRPLTWVGLALGAAFFLGLFIDTVNVRWWIMLPLGIASFLILWKQWKSTPEERNLELKLTFFGMVAMLGFLILRDAWLSGSLANIYEQAKKSGETIREFQDLIGR